MTFAALCSRKSALKSIDFFAVFVYKASTFRPSSSTMAETFRGSIENFKTTKEPPPWDHYKTNSDSSSLQFHGLNAKVHLNGSTVLNGERLAQPVDLYAKVLSMRLSDTETMVFLQMGETRENARNAMITIASPASSKAEAKK